MFSMIKYIFNHPLFNLSAAMLIVGSSVICGKTITQDFPLFLASELRFLIAAALFLPLGIYRRPLFHLPPHDWILLAIMAFCGQILFTLLFLLGLRYTSGINAGTLTSSTPFFMAVFSFFILRERFTVQQITGLLFAFSSIFFLGYSSFYAFFISTDSQWLGNVLVLGAVSSEAVFLLLVKKLHSNVSGLSITALLVLLGALFCLPPALAESASFDFSSLKMTDAFAIFYFGAIYTNLAYFFWFRGVAHANGATSSACTALMPLSASFLSTLFLDEHFSVLQISALSAALLSIFLLTIPARKGIDPNESQTSP